jgi:hypothetical protein
VPLLRFEASQVLGQRPSVGSHHLFGLLLETLKALPAIGDRLKFPLRLRATCLQLRQLHPQLVIQANELSTPLVWIEHGPKEAADGGEEMFELGVFSSYKVEAGAPTVEVLVGEKV